MFENIFGAPKERRTQLFFRDDGAFEFRKLPIEDTFLVLKKGEEIVKGWIHSLNNQFPFPGYHRIPSDQVTLSFDRNILLDPYNLVRSDEKPEALIPPKIIAKIGSNGAGPNGVQRWLAQVGESRRTKLLSNRAKRSNVDKMITYLGAGFIAELLIFGILVAQNARGG